METTGIILLLLSASFGAEALPTNAGAAEQIAASGAVPVAQQIPASANGNLSPSAVSPPAAASSSTAEKGARNQGQTSSSASLVDLKNGFSQLLGTQLGSLGNQGSSLGGLGAIGLGLGLGLAKAKAAASASYGAASSADASTYGGQTLRDFSSRVAEAVPNQGMGRVARFFLDLGGGGGGNGGTDYGSQLSGFQDQKNTQNLLNLDLNAQEIEENLFKPENIATHVGQNFFNFVVTTIAWCVAGALFGQTNTNGGDGDLYRNLFGKGGGKGNILGLGGSGGSSSGYGVPATSTSTSYGAPAESTYSAAPDSSYGAPAGNVITSSSGGLKSPFSQLAQKFNGFGIRSGNNAAQYSRSDSTDDDQFVSPAQMSYETRAGSMPNVAQKSPNDLTVEEMKKMLEMEEQAKAGVFDGMSDLDKYRMYKKAQMMLALKKLKEEEQAIEQMVAEEEVAMIAETTPSTAAAAVSKPVKRRIRKRIMAKQPQH